MSDYRLSGFDLPLSHHNEDSLTRWSLWTLVIAVLLFASYALIWSAAQTRVAHTPPGIVAAPWPVK
jgi:hypothetical protein